MKEYFGIPWEELDYPYAPPARTISGVGWSAASVWIIIRPGRSWTVRLQREPESYRYLQALYGMPAAILASGPRADGLRRFLEQELGMGGGVLCPPGGALRPGGLLPGAARLRGGASVWLLL